MAYPVPSAAQFNAPWFQAFLAEHPVLAAQNSPREVAKFLDAHPKIAERYVSLLTAGQRPATPPPAPAPAAAPLATPAASADPQAASAKAAITAALDSYGLGALGQWAWQQYLGGTPTEQIMLDLRQQPQYAQRFPGMAELSKKGRAISEAEYISLERSYAQQARAYGLPEGFYDDPADFGKLIAGEVSAQEWGDRLKMGMEVTLSNPRAAAMRDYLAREEGMVNALGATMAYWIDPDVGSDIIKRQFAAAQVAAEASLTGFASLNKTQAERIADTGITADAARQSFAQLAGLKELQAAGLGDAGSTAVTTDDMIGAAFTGDAAAQEKLRTESRRRTATFDAGGGYATGQGGISGLGTA